MKLKVACAILHTVHSLDHSGVIHINFSYGESPHETEAAIYILANK